MARNDTKTKEKRRRQQQVRIDRRVDYLKAKGITSSITYKNETFTPKQLARKSEDFIKKAVKSELQKRRVAEAQRYARTIGASPEEAKKVRSFKAASTFIANTFRASKYLAVAWHDTTGEGDLTLSILHAQKMTPNQLWNHIQNLRKVAEFDRDGSDQMKGVHYIAIGSSRKDVETRLKKLQQKGYEVSDMIVGDKVVQVPIAGGKDFEKVVISNEFSEKGFLSLMYVVMSNTANIYTTQFYNDMEAFCRYYCPGLYAKIFS